MTVITEAEISLKKAKLDDKLQEILIQTIRNPEKIELLNKVKQELVEIRKLELKFYFA